MHSRISVSYLEGILLAKRGRKIKLPWATHPCLHCSHCRWFIFPGLKLWQLQFRVQLIACKREHGYTWHVSDAWDTHWIYKTKPPFSIMHWAVCAHSGPDPDVYVPPWKTEQLDHDLEVANTLHGHSAGEKDLQTSELFEAKIIGWKEISCLLLRTYKGWRVSHILTKFLNWPEQPLRGIQSLPWDTWIGINRNWE